MIISDLGRFNFILKTLFSRFSTMSMYFIYFIKLFNENIVSSVLTTFDTGLLNFKKPILLNQCYFSEFIFWPKEISAFSS